VHYLLGVDPGLRNLGTALVELLPKGEMFLEMDWFCTLESPKKLKILSTSDNVRRVKEVASFLGEKIQRGTMIAICAESMSFPRNASSSAKIGMCWGVLGAFSDYFDVPIIQASPQEIKKAVCGIRNASKEDIQNALNVRYQKDSIVSKAKTIAKTNREHPYDALASIVACLESETIQMARKLMDKSARIE
jgi:crossover junction endodeoxyribonuclease RuvC